MGKFQRSDSAHLFHGKQQDDVEKMNKIEEEFNKASLALKKILNYGHNFEEILEEFRDESTSKVLIKFRTNIFKGDLNIKNEINILYSEIVDQKISLYLHQFLNTIQVMVFSSQN